MTTLIFASRKLPNAPNNDPQVSRPINVSQECFLGFRAPSNKTRRQQLSDRYVPPSCLQNCRVSWLSSHLLTKRLSPDFLARRPRYFIRPPYHAGLINGSNGPFRKQNDIASDAPTGSRSVCTAVLRVRTADISGTAVLSYKHRTIHAYVVPCQQTASISTPPSCLQHTEDSEAVTVRMINP